MSQFTGPQAVSPAQPHPSTVSVLLSTCLKLLQCCLSTVWALVWQQGVRGEHVCLLNNKKDQHLLIIKSTPTPTPTPTHPLIHPSSCFTSLLLLFCSAPTVSGFFGIFRWMGFRGLSLGLDLGPGSHEGSNWSPWAPRILSLRPLLPLSYSGFGIFWGLGAYLGAYCSALPGTCASALSHYCPSAAPSSAPHGLPQ